ncbi:50S ribosomal protein L44e [Candidatus Woesearchaeota archaeon]|nr:50S ribosomal protein L44e [Candidatus Woesearchaeota archaeon]
MKLPKTTKRLCKSCKTHTEHKISQAKRRTPGSAHPLGKYAKKRTGFGKGFGNLGKYGSKPAVSKFKMTGAKTTKKLDLRYECTTCKKMSVQSKGIRVKRVEFV